MGYGYRLVQKEQTSLMTPVHQSPPPPHSLISTFLPLMPPGISRPLITGSRYLNMLSQVYKDGSLMLFGVGLMVIVSEYVYGGVRV